MARRPSSVRPSVCKLLRKSLLLAGKWPDRYQTFTRWTPGQRASRMCLRSRSKVTWYAHFFGLLEWATPSLTVWFLLTSLTVHRGPTIQTKCLYKFSDRNVLWQNSSGDGRRGVVPRTTSRCRRCRVFTDRSRSTERHHTRRDSGPLRQRTGRWVYT